MRVIFQEACVASCGSTRTMMLWQVMAGLASLAEGNADWPSIFSLSLCRINVKSCDNAWLDDNILFKQYGGSQVYYSSRPRFMVYLLYN